MSAAARRACVCRSQFLFAVVQWATVCARGRSDQGRFQHGAHQGVTSKQVKRPEIDFCRPRRPRGSSRMPAQLRRIGARS